MDLVGDMNNENIENAIKEFKRKCDTINKDGGFLEHIDGYEALDFDMDAVEDWLAKNLQSIDQQARGEERQKLEKIHQECVGDIDELIAERVIEEVEKDKENLYMVGVSEGKRRMLQLLKENGFVACFNFLKNNHEKI